MLITNTQLSPHNHLKISTLRALVPYNKKKKKNLAVLYNLNDR